MATVDTLNVELTATTAKFTRELKRAAAGAQRLGKKISQSLEKNMGKIAASSAAVGLALRSTMKAFGEFESTMIRVGAVSNTLGTQQFTMLEKRALDLAKTSKFSAKEVADGMKFMAMAGQEAETIMEGIPAVLDLAAAGAIDMGSAANIVTNIMAGFGKEANELGHSVDVVTKAITSANVDTNQLGESFAAVGPIAKAAGWEFESVTAALGLLGNAGIQGGRAGTGLKRAITQLLNPTKEVSGIMRQMGFSATDSNGKLRDLGDIIAQLGPYANDAGLMMKLFGNWAGPIMAQLVATGHAELDKLTDSLITSGGTAKRIAEAEMKSFDGAMKMLKSNVEAAQIALGEQLAPAIATVAKGISSATQWFTDLSDVTKGLIGDVTLFTTAMIGLAVALTAASAAAVPLLALLGGLGLIAAGILAIIGSVEMLSIAFEQVGKAAEWMGDVIADAFNWLGKGARTVFVNILGMSEDSFDGMAKAAKKVAKFIKDVFLQVVQFAVAPVKWMWEVFKTAADFWKKRLGVAVGGMPAMPTGGAQELPGVPDVGGGGVRGAAGAGAPRRRKALDKVNITLNNPEIKIPKGQVFSADYLKGIQEETRNRIISAKAMEATAAQMGPVRLALEEAANQAASFGQIFAQASMDMLGKLGIVGEVAQGAIQGGTAGGPWGAIIGAVMALLDRTTAFGQIVEIMNGGMSITIDALNMLLKPIVPLIDGLNRFGEVTFQLMNMIGFMGPIMESLYTVMQGVGKVITWVANGIASVWNAIARGIASLLRKIAKYVPVGRGSLRDAARKIEGGQISFTDTSPDQQQMPTQSFTGFDRGGFGEGAGGFSGTGDLGGVGAMDVSANVPTGLKLNLARFKAMQSEVPGLPATDEAKAAGAATGDNIETQVTGDVNVNVISPEELAKAINEINENLASEAGTVPVVPIHRQPNPIDRRVMK